MQITRLELQNIKSYKDAIIEFEPGTNAVCGENGAGKSTLLEAIGFVMFGYSSMRQADFVREGERSGTITLAFIANDEREYELVRRLGTSNTYYVYDPDPGIKVAEGKADVQDWLCARIGVPMGTDLSTLFSDAFGVPQGLLATIFLEGAPQRHSKFDPLLRVDEYRRARDNLREAVRCLEEQITGQDVAIARLETSTEPLPEIERSLADLADQIGQDEGRLELLTGQVEELGQQVAAFEAQRSRLDGIRQRLELEGQRLLGSQRQRDSAEANLARARQAAEDVERARAGHEAYGEAQETIEELETQRKARDGLTQKKTRAEKALTQVQGRIQAATALLEEIAAAEERLEALGPRLRLQEGLEGDIRLEEGRVARLGDLHQQAERSRAALEKLAGQLEDVEGKLEALTGLEELAAHVAPLEVELNALVDGIGHARAQLAQARRSRTSVEGGLCPFLGEPCRNLADGMSLTDYFDGQIEALTGQLEALDKDRARVQGELARAREAANRLASAESLQEAQGRLESQRDEGLAHLNALESEIADLDGAPERLQAIRARLEELGDCRGEHAIAAATAGRRAETEASLARDQEEATRSGREIEGMEATLATYADLDDRLDALRGLLRQHEPDHLTFLRNQTLAGQVPGYEDALALAEEEVSRAEEALATLQEDHAAASAEYDEAEHQRIAKERRQLESEAVTLEERLRLNKGRLKELGRQIERIRGELAELEALREQHEADRGLLEFLQYARQLIVDAGPHVTRALVERISAEAGRIFCEIMNDYTMHLVWDEEYEISIEKAGNVRTFRQLSGGEQMAAAIAVRLALLREVSNVDVAFFDEPTANLDEIRRESLADQIVGVRGFSQIFVISHDDSFERVTNHTVRVYKENGVSRVTNGSGL